MGEQKEGTDMDMEDKKTLQILLLIVDGVINESMAPGITATSVAAAAYNKIDLGHAMSEVEKASVLSTLTEMAATVKRITPEQLRDFLDRRPKGKPH